MAKVRMPQLANRAEVRLGQGQASMQAKHSQEGKTEDMLGKIMKSTFILV